MHTSHKIWLFSSISGVQRRCLLPPSPAQRGKVRKGAFKSIKNNDLFSCFSPPPRPSPASGRGGYTEHLNSCVHRVAPWERGRGEGLSATLLFFFFLIFLSFSAQAQSTSPSATDKIAEVAGKAATTAVNLVQCVVCSTVESYLMGGLTMHEKYFTAFANGTQNLVAVMLVLWMLMELAKMLTPFTPLDRITKLFNGVFNRFSFAILAVLAMQSPKTYLDYIFYPIIKTTLAASGAILDSTAKISNPSSTIGLGCATLLKNTDPKQAIVKSLSCQTAYAQGQIGKLFEITRNAMFDEIGVNWDTYKKQALGQLSALGTFQSWLNGFRNLWNTATSSGKNLVDLLLRVVVMFVVMFIYAWVLFIYPLRLVGLVFQWGIVTLFSPILMGTFVFPSLRQTGMAGLRGLGHGAMTLLVLSLFIGIIAAVANQIATDVSNFKDMFATTGDAQAATKNYLVFLVNGMVMLYMLNQAPNVANIFFRSRLFIDAGEGILQSIKGFFMFALNFVPGGTVVQGGLKVLGVK
jgi:hypothetical protein